MDARIYCDYPSLLALAGQAHGFSLLPHHSSGSVLSGRHGSRFRGRGLNFEELRHYREGDDIRTLDWKVTLRTGKPHVRSYSEEKDRHVMVLVDQRQSLFFASQHSMKSVVAARLAAVLGWRVIKDNDRVGALVFTDTQQYWHEPKRSAQTWMRALADLAEANQRLTIGRTSAQGAQQLDAALARAARLQSKNAVFILVSDLHGWSNSTVERLKQLQIHNDVFCCWVRDPLEYQLEKIDGLIASDGQLQLEVDASANQLGSKYIAQAQAKQDELTRLLRRSGLPLLIVDTRGDELQQLKRALNGGAA